MRRTFEKCNSCGEDIILIGMCHNISRNESTLQINPFDCVFFCSLIIIPEGFPCKNFEFLATYW